MAAFTVACSQQHPRDRVLRPVVSLHPGDVANVQAHQQAREGGEAGHCNDNLSRNHSMSD